MTVTKEGFLLCTHLRDPSYHSCVGTINTASNFKIFLRDALQLEVVHPKEFYGALSVVQHPIFGWNIRSLLIIGGIIKLYLGSWLKLGMLYN